MLNCIDTWTFIKPAMLFFAFSTDLFWDVEAKSSHSPSDLLTLLFTLRQSLLLSNLHVKKTTVCLALELSRPFRTTRLAWFSFPEFVTMILCQDIIVNQVCSRSLKGALDSV